MKTATAQAYQTTFLYICATLLTQSASADPSIPRTTFTHWLLPVSTFMTTLALFYLLVQAKKRYFTRTEQLNQNEKNYKMLAEHANVIHWKYNVKNDRVTYVSPQIRSILGYEPEHWDSVDAWAEQIHPDDRETVLTTFSDRTSQGKDSVLEYRCIDSTGQVVWIRDIVTVRMGQDGPAELIGFMADISEYKMTLTKHDQSTQTRIQFNKIQALGQISGGVAHDFNTLLAIIQWNCQLLEVSHTKAEFEKYTSHINSATETGKDLIKSMLSLQNDKANTAKPLRLPSIIEEQVDVLRASIPEAITINLDIEWDLPPVSIYKLHVQQLLMNLINNARDSMSKNETGQLTVSAKLTDNISSRCSLCRESIDGKWIDICVRDSGCGIHVDDLTQLFEPFYTSKPANLGNGIGLAVIAGIIQHYNGHVYVCPNTRGAKGSEFHILLPTPKSTLS